MFGSCAEMAGKSAALKKAGGMDVVIDRRKGRGPLDKAERWIDENCINKEDLDGAMRAYQKAFTRSKDRLPAVLFRRLLMRKGFLVVR